MRLINADALKKIYMLKGKDKLRLSTVINELELQPAVEAVPVVHGKWSYGDWDKDHHWIEGTTKVRCSECWRVFDTDNLNIWHWCPQCGAKMQN